MKRERGVQDPLILFPGTFFYVQTSDLRVWGSREAAEEMPV